MSWIWIILGIILIVFAVWLFYKAGFHYAKKLFYSMQAKHLRFMMVKIPRKESDSDQRGDNVQNMKQNIEIMNQVYKNFSSIMETNMSAKIFGQPFVSLEIMVEKEVIKFMIGVPKDHMDSFEKMISSFYPGAVIDIIDQPKILNSGMFASGGYFVLSKDDAYPIKTYETFEADPMDSILSAFSRVDWEEKLNLQIMVSPLGESWQKKLRAQVNTIKEGGGGGFSIKNMIFGLFSGLFNSGEESGEKKDNNGGFSSQQIQDIEKKVEDEGFQVSMRALVVSPEPKKTEKLINDLTRAFSQYNYVGLNSFKFLPAKDINDFIKDFVNRTFTRPLFTWKSMLFFIKSQILNIKELSSIFHFPHTRFNRNPRIKWQNFKIVPAPDNLPKEGILLGHNLYSGVKKEIRVQPSDRFRHFYTIGQTGTGKSTMLSVQAKQDCLDGRGFAMIDPHGDLCELILQYYPKERIDDLIYFDAADFDMPIGFNIFEAETEEEQDIIVNDAVDMFVKMYGPEIFGPRIQDYFRHAALTLMVQPDGGTMTEIMRLFTDEAYANIKIKHVKNPVIRGWWEKTYKAMGDREKKEIIPFFQSKFSPFTTLPIIRNIIGQPRSSFDIFKAMQEGKVILFNLSKGKMGELNSELLGTMMVTKIKTAALRRATLPQEQRSDFFLYIDEFQNYITPSIETVLSEARKYRLGLIIAHQYIDQLMQKGLGGETDLRPAVFGNVGTIMSYKVGAKDAEYLEQEFNPEYSRTDLVNMDKYKGVIKVSIDTQPSRPFSISVLNPYTDEGMNTPEKVKVIKEISRLKWGRKRDLVEKEIYYRVGA